MTKELIDRIFKEPGIKYELTEFETLGKPIHEILSIYLKTVETGRDAGKTKYYLKSFVPFSSGKEEIQVHVEGGKSAPEEIVRQLWVYKLIHQYGYQPDEIDLEMNVQFGTEVGTKAADIIVYTDSTKETPKIIIECKKPKRKDGIEQLKSYMNAKGAPVAVWSNGSDRVLLYRPYPAGYDDTLVEIPRREETPKDVIEKRRTLSHLETNFNFKEILYDIEELALANYGDGVFEEIFKLIFAKIYDEIEAEDRPDKEVLFQKFGDAELTYNRINSLLQKAIEKWPGIFKPGEKIELKPSQLSICIGPMILVRLMGSNLRIMDDAFEYLVPSVLKKKDGQFFTPRHIIDMCVRMLNPKRKEYIIDPACGSSGFLLHAMDWCYPAKTDDKRETRKYKYASKYLWGIDISEKSAKTSRALMLIAGDGHSKIFGPRISSLDPSDWLETRTGQLLIEALRKERLLKTMPDNQELIDDEKDAWKYLDELKFDIVLTNPPFAGEVPGKKLLKRYELARRVIKRAGDKKTPVEELDVLFIERVLKMLKPGGRAAIVLPQGKFNNSSLAFIREWILKKARLLAVVGLHPNTFKPHTGTKTSVLFLQKYTAQSLARIEQVKQEVANACPDYEQQIKNLIAQHGLLVDLPEEKIPEEIVGLMAESFAEPEPEITEKEPTFSEDEYEIGEEEPRMAAEGNADQADLIREAEEKCDSLRAELISVKQKLTDLTSDVEALKQQHRMEIDAITQQWESTKADLRAHLKPIKADQKASLKKLKDKQKIKQWTYKAEIKHLEKVIPDAEITIKLLSNKGKLELILTDPDLIGTLKERWIAAEAAKRLDYPIFMAVSERGGKNNSGDYDYRVDADGSLLYFPDGHPQEGQLVVDQDLVNYDMTTDDLVNTTKIPDEQLCVAEAFVRFAQEQGFDFWEMG
ncbi:MAG: N-6 DNA methylase [Proteobacteria bacterium]|nr:N-6 DNA methylase [Pseudomonadota bacterium]